MARRDGFTVVIRAAGASHKKVVATANRCERVYKRAGKLSVPFCEKGAAFYAIKNGAVLAAPHSVRCVTSDCLRQTLHISRFLLCKNAVFRFSVTHPAFRFAKRSWSGVTILLALLFNFKCNKKVSCEFVSVQSLKSHMLNLYRHNLLRCIFKQLHI